MLELRCSLIIEHVSTQSVLCLCLESRHSTSHIITQFFHAEVPTSRQPDSRGMTHRFPSPQITSLRQSQNFGEVGRSAACLDLVPTIQLPTIVDNDIVHKGQELKMILMQMATSRRSYRVPSRSHTEILPCLVSIASFCLGSGQNIRARSAI